jgi:hypothetical protein
LISGIFQAVRRKAAPIQAVFLTLVSGVGRSRPQVNHRVWAVFWLCGMLLGSAASAQAAVTLQLKWHHPFQLAGCEAAQAKGYCREAGLPERVGMS